MEEISKLSTTLRKIMIMKMVPLKYLAKNNPEERLVVFSFKYKNGKEEVGVWRTGPGKADPL